MKNKALVKSDIVGVDAICPTCGKKIFISRCYVDTYVYQIRKKVGKNFFCSEKCYQKALGREVVNCLYCGLPFQRKSKKTKFCSEECRRKYKESQCK